MPVRTLADLIIAIESDPELSPRRKQDRQSAVRRFGTLFDLSLETALAGPDLLRRHGKHFHPAQVGMAQKTWRNIRSGVAIGISRYAAPYPSVRDIPFAADWQQLRSRLTRDELLFGLSRIMRFASLHGISPEAVDDAFAARFLDWLRNDPTVKNPEALFRRNLVLWNKAATTIDGCPRHLLTVPSNRRTYTLTWDAIPIGLRRDAEAWLDHLATADPFRVDPFANDPTMVSGPFKPLAPDSIASRRFQVRQLVSALHLSDWEIGNLHSLADLVTFRAAQDALRFFWKRNGEAPSSMISGLAGTLVAIARHWVHPEPAQLDALVRLKTTLASPQYGLTARNRERLRQFDSRRNLERFLGLPDAIHRRVRRNKPPTLADARLMGVAVAIELLLMAPIRRKNLTRLRTGPDGHVRMAPSRPKDPVFIVIPAAEVKNRVDLEFPIPSESADLLREYVHTCRPLLSDDPGDWLFPGARPGTPKSLDQMSRSFSKVVFDLTGLRVNLHLMRHLGARLYLTEKPGAYETVRRVLAHKALSTTVNHYTGLESEAAVRHYDSVILGLRDAVRREVDDA